MLKTLLIQEKKIIIKIINKNKKKNRKCCKRKESNMSTSRGDVGDVALLSHGAVGRSHIKAVRWGAWAPGCGLVLVAATFSTRASGSA